MKGSGGKNKPGKLETHFSCDAHTAALRDYTNFVCEGGQIDALFTKQQRRSIVNSESEKGKSREATEVLFDVAKTLTRNGLALCGNNADENGDTRPDVSHSDELSVAVRYVDVDSCMPKERLVRITETINKTGAG